MSKNKNKKSEKLENSAQAVNEAAQTEEVATEATENTAEATEEACAEDETTKQIAELEAQLAEMKDKYLRQVAEFDNYRKRTLKEKAELILNGSEKVMTSLLPVLDDFERAQQNFEKSEDINALKEGVNLIHQKFIKELEAQGLKQISTDGEDFNIDFHEAIAMVPVQEDAQKGKVIDCVQAGYTLNDKVIRHAKVAIGQ